MPNATLTVVLNMDDDDLQTKILKNQSSLASFAVTVNQTGVASKNLDMAVQSAGASFAGWNLVMMESARAFEELSAKTTEFAEKIIDVNSGVQKTTILLQGLSHAATEAGREMDGKNSMKGLLDMAADSPFKLETLTDTFVKMKTAGIDPLKGGMKALMDSISAFGGDDSRLQRAGYAIQEMAGRGVLSLQNLRRQLGQDIPGAVALMARSLNLTVEELDQKVQTGTFASGHALQLMLDEFNRTYGGATGQLMQTFTGRIAQVTNSLQRLALVAGGTVRPSLDNLFGDMTSGQTNKNSSYAEAVNQVAKINDMLKSPEMVASAISLNNALKSMAETAGSFAKFIIEWRDPILTTVEVVGTLVSALVGLKAAIMAYELALASAAMVGGVFTGVTKAIVGLPQMFAMVASSAGLAGNMLKALGASVLGLIDPGMVAAAEAAGGLEVALAGLAAGFAIVAVPVAIVAGIAMIIQHMRELSGATSVTTDAIQRLIQGDITQGNVSSANEELKDLDQHIAAMKKRLEDIDAFQKHTKETFSQEGFGEVKGFTPAIEGEDVFSADLSKETERFKKQIADQVAILEITENDAAQRSMQADSQRLAIMATQHFDSLKQSLESGFQSYETTYKDTMEKIAAAREATMAKPGNNSGEINTENTDSKQAAIDELKGFDVAMNAMLAGEQAHLKTAVDEKNASEIKFYSDSIQHLKAYMTEKNQIMQDGIDEQGTEDNGAGSALKINKKAAAEAVTDLDQLTQKAAVLQARLEDTGTAAAKLAAMLKLPGFDNIGDTMTAQLEKAAAKVDALTLALKNQQEVTKANKAIDLGYDKAAEQLQMYTDALTNGPLTSGEKRVDDLQRDLNEHIAGLRDALLIGEQSIPDFVANLFAVGSAAAHAQDAVDKMSAAVALEDAEALKTRGHDAYVNSLKPVARAAEQAKDRSAALASEIVRLTSGVATGQISWDNYTKAMKEATDGTNQLNAASNVKSANAGAKAAKPGDDAINGMKDKIAELIAAMRGGDSELAKWNQKIADQPAVYGASAAALRALATEQDALMKSTEKSKAADEALKSLQKTGTDLTIKKEDIDAENKLLNVKSRILDVEKQIVAFQTGQDRTVAIAEAQLNDKELVAKKGLLKIEQEIAAAKAQAGQNEAENTMIVMDEKLLDLKKQMIEADGKSAKGYKENSALIDEEAAQLTAMYKSAADASHVSAAQQEADIKTITDWAIAEHAALAKKDSDYFQKLINDWGNAEKQIGEVGKSALDGFNSQLETALTKGKANWKEFTDSVIKDLIGMILKMTEAAALQSALSAFGISSGEGAGAMGGVGGGIMSLLGIGGSGAAAGGGADAFAGAGEAASGWHTGGVLGSDTSTFTRSISSSEFANAIRYHTGGIAGDEVPSILQKGEGVFTAGQMGQIGDLNSGYMAMAGNISRLVDTMTNPPASAMANAMPGSVTPAAGSTGGSGAGMQHIFNINNQSPTPVTATQTGSRREGDQMIIDIIMKAASQPGPLRSTLATVGR